MSDRRRNALVLLVVLGLVAASVAVIVTKPTRLGLDLQGGVQLVYEGRPTKQQPKVTQEALDRSLDIMRQRVDAFGVAEPEIQRAGTNQIEVSLPGVANAQRAAEQVGSTAQLFFYDWEANVLDADCRTNPDVVNGGQSAITGLYNAVLRASKCKPQDDANNNAASAPRYYAFDKQTKKPFNNGQASDSREEALEDLTDAQRARAEVLEVPTGILVIRDEKQSPTSAPPDRWWVIQDNPGLSGTDIRNPEQGFDERQGNQPNVRFEFTPEGRRAFQDITREIAQRGTDNALGSRNPLVAAQHFAIVLDDELVQAPFIDFNENPDGIDGSTGAQISGGFTIQSAQDVAKLLKIGALPLKLELVSRSQVSATLGQQALNQGLTAAIGGFVIVVLFLIVFYRILGVVAAVAMLAYALYFYALVELIPITLTLPGLAGLILTLGVAADANIVVFERVKEEVRAGRSIPTAIATGYRKGLSTILDANVVTLLVAFILFVLATAGVKGFAFMLGIGTIVSLFTAVLATQAILLSCAGRGCCGARRRSGRLGPSSASGWTTWARRSGSSPHPASSCSSGRCRSPARASTSASTSSRAPGSPPRSSAPRPSGRSATRSRPSAWPTRRSRLSATRSSATTSCRSPRAPRASPSGWRTASTTPSGSPTARTSRRSGRRSAPPSPTRRSSRSSRRWR